MLVANINNAGPGLPGRPAGNPVSPISRPGCCSFTMLLGRLEVLSLAVVFTPSSGERRVS